MKEENYILSGLAKRSDHAMTKSKLSQDAIFSYNEKAFDYYRSSLWNDTFKLPKLKKRKNHSFRNVKMSNLKRKPLTKKDEIMSKIRSFFIDDSMVEQPLIRFTCSSKFGTKIEIVEAAKSNVYRTSLKGGAKKRSRSE